MARKLALVGLVAMAALWAAPASAASPWDGEWEGEIKQPRLTCAPCKMRMSVKDGIPNIRGDVSVQTFTIDGAGQVNAFVIIQIGYAADCSLRGQINGDVLTASGRCVGSRIESPELTLRRVSSSAGLPAPPAPQPAPSASGTTRPPSPSASAPPPSSASAPPGRGLTPPTAAEKVFGAGTQALRLAELTYDMPEGDRIGEFQIRNWLTSCGEGKKLVVTRKTFTQPTIGGYQAIFTLLGRSRGYTVSGLVENNGVGAASYMITARVMAMDWVGCVRENTKPPEWSGSGKMTIAWQVLRSSDGQTVFSTTTQTASSLGSGERRVDGLTYLYATTFGDAVVQLISMPAFRDAVRTPVSATDRPRVSSDSSVVRTPPLFRGPITNNMKSILPGVVEVRPAGGGGSGFVIDASGLIVTNAHVVRGGDTVAVAFSDGDRVNGTVIKRDLVRDVALIRVDKTGLKPLPIRRGEPVLTEKVYAIGSPFGLSQTVTEGIVSSYRRQQNGLDLIQATASISPGNSGGPLLDSSGNVIGISQFLVSPGVGTDFRFFIPIDSALARLDLRLVGR